MSQTIIVFLTLIQILVTALDLGDIYWRKGRPLSREVWEEFFFLASIWLAYFVIQGIGGLLLFKPESLRFWIAGLSNPNSVPIYTWRVCLMIYLSFQLVALADYATHRWILHRDQLWVLHEYHHVAKKIFNGMPGISSRPYAFVATFLSAGLALPVIVVLARSFLSAAELATFGDQGIVILFGLFGVILILTHSSFLRRWKFTHWLFAFVGVTTPQEHLLHHSSWRHTNYGNFCTWWDRFFGSYTSPVGLSEQKEELGLGYDQDFLGALCRGRWKMAQSLRQRFRLKDFVCLRD